MVRRLLVVSAATLGFLAAHSAAIAQSGDSAILYSRALYKGPAITVTGPTRSMGGFVVKSLKLPPNSAWELCTGNTFTGCTKFTQSRSGMVMTVRSARPVAPPITASTIAPVAHLKGSDLSLRGLASEFFVMPQEGGARIEVDDRAKNDSARATEFCRSHGWRISAYERQQAVDRRRYLADVLCTDGAR